MLNLKVRPFGRALGLSYERLVIDLNTNNLSEK